MLRLIALSTFYSRPHGSASTLLSHGGAFGPDATVLPRLVRWAPVEATQRLPRASTQAVDFHRIADRRGTGVGRVAAARKLLTLVYYGLRDGQVRCLALAPRQAM
jgi:hypothetical protein